MNIVIARVIWWCEVASLFLLGIILTIILGGERGTVIIPIDWTIQMGLGAAALMTAGFTFIIPKIFADVHTTSINTSAVDDLRSISRLRLLPLFLSQLISLYGFVPAAVGGRMSYYWPFAALSLILLIIHRPK